VRGGHRVVAPALAVGLALLVVGCGPIEYVSQVTRRASSDVAAARAVRADRYAPYWFTLAVEYLHKARAEAAHADYQAATRFGRRASEAARRARQVALEVASDPAAASDIAPAEGGLAPLDEGAR
jgi:hypothetical protein